MEEAKKKLSGGKIAAIVIAAVLVVVLIAAGGFAIWLFGAKQPESVKVDYQELDVSMMDKNDPTGATIKYYVGKDNKVNLTKGFPGATNFSGAGVSSDGVINNARDGKVSFTNAEGEKVSIQVYAVDGYNVYGTLAEKNMHKYLEKGESVVMHEDMTTKDSKTFVMAKGAHLYGNGKELHADSISAPKNQDKNKDTSWGATVFGFGDKDHSSFHIQDLHLFVNTIKPDAEGKYKVDLESFEFSGTGVDFNAYDMGGVYEKSSLVNCIVENGQKLVHVQGGDILIEGCIIRNGADANIAAGTYKHNGPKITLRNSVSMNSLVAGFLFYGWDPANSDANQTTLNIEGFFDIYNWKATSAAKLVPSTEAPLDKIVNGQVLKSVNDKMFAPFVYFYDQNKDGKIQMPAEAAKNYPDRQDEIEVSEKIDERFIHIGIIRLSTGSLTNQDPKIQFNGVGSTEKVKNPTTGKEYTKAVVQPNYSEVLFPLPEWVQKKPLDIVKRCDMVSYDCTKTPDILPDQQLDPNTIFKDMIYGREGRPVPEAK